jgi:hypothetical protein
MTSRPSGYPPTYYRSARSSSRGVSRFVTQSDAPRIVHYLAERTGATQGEIDLVRRVPEAIRL